jgi:hypothetical protein
VAQYSIKLCTYDPVIIDAFDRLRKNRKQAAFTHEALKQFLSTEKGGQVLQLMEGKATTEPSLRYISLSSDTPCIATPSERVAAKTHSAVTPQNDSGSVLDSILE